MELVYFDCLRCGAVTPIVGHRRCASCGGSTGVLAKSPQGAIRKLATPAKANEGNTDKPRRAPLQ